MIKVDLKVVYDPDKQENECLKLTLVAIGDPVANVEIIRCAFETFKVQLDLKDACCNWDQQEAAPTWARMMTHFSIEIQHNCTDPSKTKRQGETNAVLQQVEQQKEEQRP